MAHNAVLRLLLKAGYSPTCIFDVGANVGLTAQEFGQSFPHAIIHAFEPVPATYDLLTANLASRPNVHCNRPALGRTFGEVKMAVAGVSPGNGVLLSGSYTKGETDIVPQLTGEEYCANRQIDQIGFLKIDTEGRDLDVLLGFGRLIQANRIDFVQMECGLAPDNSRHVPLTSMQAVLFAMGYRMFGLFDVMPQRRSNFAGAFYGNVVYVRPDLPWPPVAVRPLNAG